jgi:hypothetical protein
MKLLKRFAFYSAATAIGLGLAATATCTARKVAENSANKSCRKTESGERLPYEVSKQIEELQARLQLRTDGEHQCEIELNTTRKALPLSSKYSPRNIESYKGNIEDISTEDTQKIQGLLESGQASELINAMVNASSSGTLTHEFGFNQANSKIEVRSITWTDNHTEDAQWELRLTHNCDHATGTLVEASWASEQSSIDSIKTTEPSGLPRDYVRTWFLEEPIHTPDPAKWLTSPLPSCEEIHADPTIMLQVIPTN